MPYEKLGLYEHNINSYEKVKKAYEEKNIASIVHATGTGKSFNALQLALDNKDKKIIYVVPSNSIIEHIKEILNENPNIDLERDFPNLEFRTYQSFVNMSKEELENLDVDLLILDEFHHLGAPVWGERINRIVEAHPNLQIFGMTAYTVRDRGTPYERDMANPETNELFSNKVVSRYDLCDAMIDGVLPKPIYRSCYSKLLGREKQIEDKILKKNAVKEEKEEYLEILNAVKKRIFEAPSTYDIIKRDVKNGSKWIYYCPVGPEQGKNDIETIMNEAYNWFKRYIREEDIILYKTTSEDGELGKKNREAFYNDQDLKGNDVSNKLRVIFAINQYNEGVHAPNVDGVILGRSTSSDIVYFEQIGRCLSVRGDTKSKYLEYEKYTYGELLEEINKRNIKIPENLPKEEIIEKLIAPVIIDLTNNHEFIRELENNLKDRVREVREKRISEPREIKIRDASFDILVENIDLFQTLLDLEERLTPVIWDDMYELAKIYYEHHGNLKVMDKFQTLNGYNYDENGYNLGNWIRTQRTAYKNRDIPTNERKTTLTPLTDEQVEMLEKIGMIFDVYGERWDNMYELAKKYYEHYSTLNIAKEFKTLNGYNYDENGYNLGNWIKSQRRAYKYRNIPREERKITLAPLTDEQVEKLKKIGMSFNPREERWNKMYELVKKYYEHYGDLIISANFKTINGYEYDENGYNLRSWINTQKKAYKNRYLSKEHKNQYLAPLTDEHTEKLKQIGMIFDVYGVKWDNMYELAKKYYEHYGNLVVPVRFKTTNGYEYDENGYTLGIWISKQRTAYKNRDIPKEERETALTPLTNKQVEMLEKIGMIFEIKYNYKRYSWDDIYNLAKNYYNYYGNLDIPWNFTTINGYEYDETGYNLGNWISNQRTAYKYRDIPKEERKNHCVLSDQQLEKLEKIGMNFKRYEDDWDAMYELAKIYYEHHNTLKIGIKFKTINGYEYDKNGYSLGRWIYRQRLAYNNKIIPKEERINRIPPLTDEQVEMLKKIGDLEQIEFIFRDVSFDDEQGKKRR